MARYTRSRRACNLEQWRPAAGLLQRSSDPGREARLQWRSSLEQRDSGTRRGNFDLQPCVDLSECDLFVTCWQIITVSDTGIDEHHCVFYDPSESASKCSGTVGYQSGCINTNHRKIVQTILWFCLLGACSDFLKPVAGFHTVPNVSLKRGLKLF